MGTLWSTRRGLSHRRGGTRRLGTVYCLNTWRHGVHEPATTCYRSDIRVRVMGITCLKYRRDKPCVMRTLWRSYPPRSTISVLNALVTVLKGRSTASCGSAPGCQDTPPDTAGVFIPLETFQASIQRSEPAASLQNQAHTLSGHTDHVGLVRRGHAAYSGLGISLQMFRSGLASVPLSRVSLSCKCLEGYTAIGQVWFRYQEVISVQI
jgi:hypothetical protein